MLKDLLENRKVLEFIEYLKTSDKYFNKKNDNMMESSIYVSSEVALYIFYDALLKYKIIIEDMYYFDEYIENLNKIYIKFNDFKDVCGAINRLICIIVVRKLNIEDIKIITDKNIVVRYIYNKYIKDGYYFHGFGCSYEDEILSNGFIPEVYENYYDKFVELNTLFSKYNAVKIIDKDFTKSSVYFTDDFIKGCYYSAYSPIYYYRFLVNQDYFGDKYRKDSYLKGDYISLISPLKRFMRDNLFSDIDKKYVLSLVRDEWNLLHRNGKRISLLVVKRSLIDKDINSVDDYLDDNLNLYDIVDRLLSSKKNNVYYDKVIDKDNLEIISFDDYYDYVDEVAEIEEKTNERKNQIEKINNDFLNDYGQVSYLLLGGAVFVSLGVIISLILIFGGN